MMNNVTKIVLTGGPCAGKTTAMVRIIEYFSTRGFQVYTLPEVPTMFSAAGINYLTEDKSYFYQEEKATLQTQLYLEDRFMEIASSCGKPALLICDRGTMDISAYMSEEMWQAILIEIGTDTIKLRDSRYDAVLHLVTAVRGAEKYFTNANNMYRSEGIELARELDKKVAAAWTGHPHLRIVDNSEDFEQKIRHVLSEISRLIGTPEPIETERKYVVEVTGDIPKAIESEITQTYLKTDADQEVRLRKRGREGSYVYFQTTKKRVSDSECIETERQISPNRYVTLLEQADPEHMTIKKIRKNFVWEKQYFELDTYMQPALGLSILEIEGVREHDEIKFPPFLKVVEDVTGNEKYYNYNLSLKR